MDVITTYAYKHGYNDCEVEHTSACIQSNEIPTEPGLCDLYVRPQNHTLSPKQGSFSNEISTKDSDRDPIAGGFALL